MYCKNCGYEIDENADVCIHCGMALVNDKKAGQSSVLRTVAKVFMVLACIASAAALLPLIWTIPMTVHYFTACNNNRQVGIAFKVCSLIFVSLVAGILMLCDNDQN